MSARYRFKWWSFSLCLLLILENYTYKKKYNQSCKIFKSSGFLLNTVWLPAAGRDNHKRNEISCSQFSACLHSGPKELIKKLAISLHLLAVVHTVSWWGWSLHCWRSRRNCKRAEEFLKLVSLVFPGAERQQFLDGYCVLLPSWPIYQCRLVGSGCETLPCSATSQPGMAKEFWKVTGFYLHHCDDRYCCFSSS